MTESKVTGKTTRKQEQKKAASSLHSRPLTRKQSRKGEKPMRLEIASGKSSGFQCSNWVCKNPVCRAILSSDDTYCKRCSCCICHLYDDNKDPSLWLECTCESGQEDSCGLSCHIECALQHKKVGVVDLGQLMQLDGSYCCASCGKVSGILGCWKKQLTAAKEARRLDVLCYRVQLSYRLLEGTSKFKEMHLMIKDAKSRLEAEVGPLNGVSTKMGRGIVSRISVAVDVQKLCSLAIEKADQCVATVTGSNLACKNSLPAACRFLFEEITFSSVIIVLLEPSNGSSNDIKGYKLWYCKSREETLAKEPVSIFPRAQRRIMISCLQPCTEYTFRIVSYTEAGDLGHSEAKCFTKSIEIICKNPKSASLTRQKEKNLNEGCSSSENRDPKTALADDSSGNKVQDLSCPAQPHSLDQRNPEADNSAGTEECCNVTEGIKSNSPDQLASASLRLDLNVGNPEENNSTNTEECCDVREVIKSNSPDHLASTSRRLDLNVASMPDLNEELTQCSRDVDNGFTMQAVEVEDDAASHGIDKIVVAKSHGSGHVQTWTNGQIGEVPALDFQADSSKKRAASVTEDPHDCNSTLINRSPFKLSTAVGKLDENFEYCVKIIRWLECEGYVDKECRLKLLTWFSIRSTEQERRVVNTFIETLIDDPVSLAGQLLDSFSEVISSKRTRGGFSGKLWH